jgi:tetratricopeptide (TPR) repeat protein
MIFGTWPSNAWRSLVAAGSAALLAACAAVAPGPFEIPPLYGFEIPSIADASLLGMGPEMHAFAAQHVQHSEAGRSRAWSLAHASLDPYVMAFDYEPHLTLTADEAFREGRGNCLSFSALFVAMARDVGLNAWFQEVVVPPKWNAVNETLLVSKHVNAVVVERGRNWVIDVSGRQRQPAEISRRISDSEATAQYYNNHGAEALVVEDLPLAYAYFGKAIEANATLPYVWSNLGVVLGRNGQLEDAAYAYESALHYDPDHSVSLNNLQWIYTDLGRFEQAAKIEARVERNRRRNPYYLHYLAEVANEEQRWADAVELLERAIRIDDNEYRFFATLAQSQYRLGQPESAYASLARARELAPGSVDQSELALPDGG